MAKSKTTTATTPVADNTSAETTFEETTSDVTESTPNVDTTDETKIAEDLANAKSTIDKEPLYHIRKTWEDTESTKGSFTDVNKAIVECNKLAGYSVFDDEGRVIHESILVITVPVSNPVLYPGKKCILKDAKVYQSPASENPVALLTGAYYLYDAQLMHGRYRIVDSKTKVGMGLKGVVGYITEDRI
jgi:hypothetical protein